MYRPATRLRPAGLVPKRFAPLLEGRYYATENTVKPSLNRELDGKPYVSSSNAAFRLKN
jgi:hypothetical protein